MARKSKETLLDRVSEVRGIVRMVEIGLPVSPTDVEGALIKASVVIEELMHRRYLAAHALDMSRDISSSDEIMSPEPQS